MEKDTDPPARHSGAFARAVYAVVIRLDESSKARWGTLGLFSVLAYLLIGQAFHPGFTEYWWYQVFQTTVTLGIVLTLETVFAREGGLAWQVWVIVVITTYVDTLGTAGHMYENWGPYDKIVHFWSGVAFAAGFYEVLGFLEKRGKVALSPRRRMVIAVACSFALSGVAWEIYEHLSDVVFHSGRVQGRADTIGDLTSDFFGSVAAVVVLRAREVIRLREDRRLPA